MLGTTFKNFVFNFENMNDSYTVCSGDHLTGNISFELTKKTKITTISIALSAVADSATLLAGIHRYPFSCQFPHGEFPSTFHSVNADISYKMTVGINRPWHMLKSFEFELNHASKIDPNDPVLQAPLLGSNTMEPSWLWCTSGYISVRARTEKAAFCFGETVKIFCEFNNGTTNSITPLVKLHQKITLYTLNRATCRPMMKKMLSVTGNVLSAHASEHTQLSITLPTTGMLSITNCPILEVEYLVELSLHVRACKDITVLFPILLCNTPVQAQSEA